MKQLIGGCRPYARQTLRFAPNNLSRVQFTLHATQRAHHHASRNCEPKSGEIPACSFPTSKGCEVNFLMTTACKVLSFPPTTLPMPISAPFCTDVLSRAIFPRVMPGGPFSPRVDHICALRPMCVSTCTAWKQPYLQRAAGHGGLPEQGHVAEGSRIQGDNGYACSTASAFILQM